MRQPHFCFALAGLSFGVCSELLGQTGSPDSLAVHCSCRASQSIDTVTIMQPKVPNFWKNVDVTGGQLTVPFKIRRKPEHGTFRLTTDVTLGAFVGLTKRLSETKEHYLTIPVTAGLTFVNVNDNNTSLEFAATDGGETDVVPGLTWSSGLILQWDDYNVGLIFGKDYASEIGDQWIYHGKMWWSFGLGFSFAK